MKGNNGRQIPIIGEQQVPPETQARLANCAYPVSLGNTVGLGMTKFEIIAMHMMASLLVSDRVQDPNHLDDMGEKAVRAAFALMAAESRAVVKAREKEEQKEPGGPYDGTDQRAPE